MGKSTKEWLVGLLTYAMEFVGQTSKGPRIGRRSCWLVGKFGGQTSEGPRTGRSSWLVGEFNGSLVEGIESGG